MSGLILQYLDSAPVFRPLELSHQHSNEWAAAGISHNLVVQAIGIMTVRPLREFEERDIRDNMDRAIQQSLGTQGETLWQ